jgi:aspartate/methionine/tyrosine aminotransferase
VRQVLALVTAPFLLEDPVTAAKFPSDVIKRAKEYLKELKSVGAYTDSRGSLFIRNQVAEFLERRDGLKGDGPDRIFLTDGASVAVRLGLQVYLLFIVIVIMCVE